MKCSISNVCNYIKMPQLIAQWLHMFFEMDVGMYLAVNEKCVRIGASTETVVTMYVSSTNNRLVPLIDLPLPVDSNICKIQ